MRHTTAGTLFEETVQNKEDIEQVWQAFEKSFEQSSSFWHFRDAYLADVRQEASETTANLDLRIKQIVKGCQWAKETEEQRMIDLLYHATIYYEICKYIQEACRAINDKGMVFSNTWVYSKKDTLDIHTGWWSLVN